MIKKLFLISAIAASLLADISNQTSNQKSDSKSERKSEQKSVNQSDSKTAQKSRGDEKSEVKTLSKNISKIKSVTKSVTKSKTGNWSISINPIPYILMQMRDLGWDKRAFALNNSDIGTTYFIDNEEDDGIIDLNKKAFNEAKASTRGKISKQQTAKLQKIIVLLNFSGKVADKSSELMRDYYDADIVNIDKLAQQAVYKANDMLSPNDINIYSCRYGGTNDIYNCNDSEYTVMLTNSVPILLKNGVPYYSADKIGFNTPSLTLSFAVNDSDALNKIEQDTDSKSVVKSVRAYTNYLEQHGQSEIASKIKSAMIEKALTENLSTTANTAIQAINSGSPTAVLRIFQ